MTLKWTALLVGATGLLAGCNFAPAPATSSNTQPPAELVSAARIMAQGQLLPAGGILRLSATPGDVVERVLVKPGESVAQDQPLIELRSAESRNAQLKALQVQLANAELEQTAALTRARQEVTVAELQLRQAQEQVASVDRRRSTLELAQAQVTDAETALARAEAIAKDPLTRSMIGSLEIDKQRAAVSSARLQYAQQQETWLAAKEAANFALQAATEKLKAAQKALELTESSRPTEVLKAQIETAEAQLKASQLVSPVTGTVLAVDARVGEAAAQFPLVQVADLSKMICRVEVYQTDAPRLAVGQTATIRNTAFSRPLRGQVTRIDRLIGNPQLRSSDPLAKVDYRTVAAILEIDAADAADAAEWLQLQVEVEIQATAAP